MPSCFAPRNFRYTVFLILLLLVLLLLFGYLPFYGSDSGFFAFSSRNLGWRLSSSIMNQIQQNEIYYQETIRERQKLIEKYGPTPDLVDAFPTHAEYYTLWNFFVPSFQCPHRVRRMGTLADGGKWVCGFERIAQKKDCVVYSFGSFRWFADHLAVELATGINGESSFEAAILEEAEGCQVFGYDFSVNSFGPEITGSPSISGRATFWPYALGAKDIKPSNESNTPRTYTLSTLMTLNGHSFIDILKIDIEGAEFESLNAFFDVYENSDDSSPEPVLPIGQMQLEVHAWNDHANFIEILHWWERLERMGLRPFWTEPNLVYINLYRGNAPTLSEYSFINIRGNHELVSNKP